MIKQEASFVRFLPKWETPPSSIFSSTMTRATGASLKANMLSCGNKMAWTLHDMRFEQRRDCSCASMTINVADASCVTQLRQDGDSGRTRTSRAREYVSRAGKAQTRRLCKQLAG